MTQYYKLTEAQEAMLEHMAFLNYSQSKPARWQDFALFEVNNKQYKLKYGTIRNNFSYLKRIGKIVRQCRSINSYYILAEYAMTSGYTSPPAPETAVTNNIQSINKDLLAEIDNLPFDTPGFHNFRLRFHCKDDDDIYNKVRSNNPHLTTTQGNKNLTLPAIDLKQGVRALVTVHHNNTVTVILDCSETPIPVNPEGQMFINHSLVHVQERLRTFVGNHEPIDIPEPSDWIVIMRHYGRDSLGGKTVYRGKTFDITLREYNGEFLHAYFKKSNNCIRIERQELTRESLADVFRKKLSS